MSWRATVFNLTKMFGRRIEYSWFAEGQDATSISNGPPHFSKCIKEQHVRTTINVIIGQYFQRRTCMAIQTVLFTVAASHEISLFLLRKLIYADFRLFSLLI